VLNTSPVLLLLTLAAYAAGVALHRLSRRHPLANPTLIAICIVSGSLILARIDYAAYFVAVQPIHLLLGPAVVGLAVPLYRQAYLLRQRALMLGAALWAGSLTAIASSVVTGTWFGLSHSAVLSLAPKSATTAVSMAIAAQISGVPAMTAVLTVMTGISGALIARYVLGVLRIDDPAARGFGMGLASHGIATASAFQESELTGAFAGLAMALNAVATAILAPPLVHLLVR
jgi:putative effector of murein hydrolase